MPIYAYQCKACGHEMEALQKISDAPLLDCPVCHAAALSKQVTAAAFRLGGTGWYETDFKQGDKKNLADNADNKAGEKQPAKETRPAAESGASSSAAAPAGAG